MSSNNTIKCPQCGLVGLANKQLCSHCGCDWKYVDSFGQSANQETEKSSSNSWIIWLVVLGFFIVGAAWAFMPTKPKEKISANSSSSKVLKNPINEPGEKIDYKEFMVEGKTNIVYFYADW